MAPLLLAGSPNCHSCPGRLWLASMHPCDWSTSQGHSSQCLYLLPGVLLLPTWGVGRGGREREGGREKYWCTSALQRPGGWGGEGERGREGGRSTGVLLLCRDLGGGEGREREGGREGEVLVYFCFAETWGVGRGGREREGGREEVLVYFCFADGFKEHLLYREC